MKIDGGRGENQIVEFVEWQRHAVNYVVLTHWSARWMYEKGQADRLGRSHKKSDAAATTVTNDGEIFSRTLQVFGSQRNFLSQVHVALRCNSRSNQIKRRGAAASRGNRSRSSRDCARRSAKVRILRVRVAYCGKANYAPQEREQALVHSSP